MSGELSKQSWMLLAVTTPFIAGLTHLAIDSLRSAAPATPEARDVSFRVLFDDRVSFPQTIRQSTIEKLLGPEYEIVARRSAADQPTGDRSAEVSESRNCRIDHHGGLLTLRVPQEASTGEIAGRLEQLSRVKSVTIYKNQ
jgi:hypothetical protein